jgi:AcrR family transcriptional regulator
MKSRTSGAPRGRPRDFDTSKALDQAMRVFWRKGYLGASITDLTTAMGINRPSMYAAFGNKQSLFQKALDRYAEGPTAYQREALEASTARAVVERLLTGVANAATDARNPRGCLWVTGVLSCGEPSSALRRELTTRRASDDAALRRRFERAIAERDLPADADASALARFVATVNFGIAVQAAAGASRAELRRVVQTVLSTWPVHSRRKAAAGPRR